LLADLLVLTRLLPSCRLLYLVQLLLEIQKIIEVFGLRLDILLLGGPGENLVHGTRIVDLLPPVVVRELVPGGIPQV